MLYQYINIDINIYNDKKEMASVKIVVATKCMLPQIMSYRINE